MNVSGTRKWIGLALRVILAGVYLVAGGMKVYDPGQFAEAVANFRMVPPQLVNLVAITLPWVEVAAAVGLLLGWWLRASTWLINAMTLVFIAAISTAVVRGLNIDCGCFGTIAGRRVGIQAIGEDVLLLAIGLGIAWIYRSRSNHVAPADLEISTPAAK